VTGSATTTVTAAPEIVTKNAHMLFVKDLIANRVIKPATTIHRKGAGPDVLLFATPRGGSTWLMELIWSQPGFRACSEPLDLRNPLVRHYLGIDSWSRLYSRGAGEKLGSYFDRLASGRLRIVDSLPVRAKHYRPFSDRTVFKVLHGAEDRIDELASRLGSSVVLLLRHPIPVTLSRRALPRLRAFVESDYHRHFDADQLRLAGEIIEGGTDLERGVVDWCFQNAVPLRQLRPEWVVVTYEQLVMQPEVALAELSRRLGLTAPGRMLERVGEASAVTRKSNRATRLLLRQGDDESRVRLLDKWREKVTLQEANSAMRILEAFEIDVYRPDSLFPASEYLIGSGGRTSRFWESTAA
jgi:hypothetical protein